MIQTVIVVGFFFTFFICLSIGWLVEEPIIGGIVAVVASFIVAGSIWGISAGYSNPRDLKCYVEDKDRAKSDGGSDMRVYTKDCGVLKVQDLLWGRQFNSADIFSSIEPGHTYLFHVSGVRVPFFSVFPNIRETQRIS